MAAETAGAWAKQGLTKTGIDETIEGRTAAAVQTMPRDRRDTAYESSWEAG